MSSEENEDAENSQDQQASEASAWTPIRILSGTRFGSWSSYLANNRLTDRQRKRLPSVEHLIKVYKAAGFEPVVEVDKSEGIFRVFPHDTSSVEDDAEMIDRAFGGRGDR